MKKKKKKKSIESKTRDKIYIVSGLEFERLWGAIMVIDKGLYGLGASLAKFHERLSTKLRLMGYKLSKSDPKL